MVPKGSAHFIFDLDRGFGCYLLRLVVVKERGLRPGTLATHQIVGIGAAFELGERSRLADQVRILALRQQLWEGHCAFAGDRLNGPPHRASGG